MMMKLPHKKYIKSIRGRGFKFFRVKDNKFCDPSRIQLLNCGPVLVEIAIPSHIHMNRLIQVMFYPVQVKQAKLQ